jgi:hypothetical protein
LIQNLTEPEAGKHKLRFYTTDTDYTKLDRFTKDASGDYYFYTV